MQSLSVSAHTAGVPAPAALALCRRCQRSLRQACQGRSWERAQRRNAAAHALAPWAGDVSGPMEGSAHASGALVPRWRGVWRRGGNRTLHRGNGHFNSCSVPSYFFGLTVAPFGYSGTHWTFSIRCGMGLRSIGLVGRCVPVPIYYFGLAKISIR